MAAKLILNIAVSLDGYIADKAGGYAWITGHGDAGQNTKAQFSFDKFLAGCGTVVMGRKAYEECGIRHIDGWQEKRFFVASHRPRPQCVPRLSARACLYGRRRGSGCRSHAAPSAFPAR